MAALLSSSGSMVQPRGWCLRAAAIPAPPPRNRMILSVGGTISGGVYDVAELYDLATAYRDYKSEMDFVDWACETHALAKTPPRSVLELGAGPGRHALQHVSRGGERAAAALDVSSCMAAFSSQLAMEMGVEVEYVIADMRTFTPPRAAPVDVALLLGGTAGHLLSNADVLCCLQSVAASLVDGGLLIIELPHPAEVLGLAEVSEDMWKARRKADGFELTVQWGTDSDEMDPVTQIRQLQAVFEWESEGKIEERGDATDSGVDDEEGIEVMFHTDSAKLQSKKKKRARQPRRKMEKVEETLPLRMFTRNEIDALAMASGVFELVAQYGGLDKDVTIDNYDEAWRGVYVLRKL